MGRNQSRKQVPPGGLSPAQLAALSKGEDPFAEPVDIGALWGGLHAVVSVSLTSRELEIIDKIMKSENKTRSEAIRTLIRRGWAYTRLIEEQEATERAS